MIVDTVKGCAYVLTCTTACTVHAVFDGASPLLVLEAGEEGQYGFVAPTDAVEVSDEHALVTQTFKGAVPGLSARDGIQPGDDATLKSLLAESGTFTGTVNANGGVNIPLAVGAATDTGAVNRLHAAGLAGVTDIFSQHAYLNTGSITATGTAATTALIPGQYAQVRVPAGTHSTIVFPFTGPNGQHNYSNFAGFSIPWRIPGAGKITIGIGRGSKTTRSDLTQGSYSIIPGNNLAHNSGEILDITFDNVRDATRGGYVVKVREIYALSKAAGWRVKLLQVLCPRRITSLYLQSLIKLSIINEPSTNSRANIFRTAASIC